MSFDNRQTALDSPTCRYHRQRPLVRRRWLRVQSCSRLRKRESKCRLLHSFPASLLSLRRFKTCRPHLKPPARRSVLSFATIRPRKWLPSSSSNLPRPGCMISSHCWQQRWNDLAPTNVEHCTDTLQRSCCTSPARADSHRGETVAIPTNDRHKEYARSAAHC